MILRALLLLLLFAATDAAAARRIAVVVGANGAPEGRTELRYAHDDARQFARMLVDVGDFRPGDVRVLEDPAPGDLLRELDQAISALHGADESLLLFYYSGHADQQSLYPAGQPLSLHEVKKRLENDSTRVRVGILDACRGGAWTGTKGLHPDDPFDVDTPLTLGSEGSVLVASTSGLEDAHEAAAIGGSFFTHHLVAGLRGAADRSGDGEVTVSEAFEYAQGLTIRDSALHARSPQRPSFELNLRGRRDLPLTRITAGSSRFALRQAEGPLQVIRLDSGLVILELPPGRREAVVAVPPGQYLVRRRTDAGTFAREVDLPAAGSLEIAEEELQLVDASVLAAKGASPVHAASTLPPGDWELRTAVGRVYDGTSLLFRDGNEALGRTGFRAFLGLGLDDGITVSLLRPGLAWKLGRTRELLLFGGFDFGGGGFSSEEGGFWHLHPIASVAGRLWLDTSRSLIAGAGIQSAFGGAGNQTQTLDAWRGEAQLGYTSAVGDSVTLAFGITAEQRFARGDDGLFETRPGVSLSFGSGLVLGARPLPLVQIHVLETVSLDGYASVGWDVPSGTLHESYLGGLTWGF